MMIKKVKEKNNCSSKFFQLMEQDGGVSNVV